MIRSKTPKILATLSSAVLSLACGVHPSLAVETQSAASFDPQAVRTFDIPADSLPIALDAYSAASGISVLCDGALARGRVSAAVRGTMSAESALTALLASSGLAAKFTQDRNVIIVLDPSVDEVVYDAGPEGPVMPLGAIHVDVPVEMQKSAGGRSFYASLLQFELQRALRHNSRLLAGRYEAQVRIWISAAGVVRRSELVSSSARVSFGHAIEQTFENLPIGQPPPADLYQPVSVRVAVEGR